MNAKIAGALTQAAGTGLAVMAMIAIFVGSILHISSKTFVLSSIGVLLLGIFMQSKSEEARYDEED
jgi:hypothetical protein